MIAEITEKKYTVTQHARERAVERLGIIAEQVVNHLNNIMQSAYYQGTTPGPRGMTRIYDHYKTNTRMILCEKGKTIITVYKMPEGLTNSGLSALNMDFLRPALEREIRKIKRESTRKIRATERQLAGQYRKLGEQFVNFSNARNPQTRALIGERIEQTENIIEGVKQGIERMKDDMQAKIKAIELIAE